MGDTLQPQERKYLRSILRTGFLTRWAAGVIVFVSLFLSIVVLTDPTALLGGIMAEPSAKRAALEAHFSQLAPQTALEKELLEANLSWNDFVWRYFLLMNIRFLSVFAANLLGVGVLTFFFSAILIKVGRLLQKEGSIS